MTDKSTGAMQEFSGPSGVGQSRGPIPGLVLLYAEAFQNLPAAWPLTTNSLSIGREQGNDFELAVPAVSRRHAEVFWSGAFGVRDLGSRNGVLVNGRRVAEALLEPMDEIRIGDAIFKFVERNAELYARYRIDGAMLGAPRQAKSESALVGGYQMDRIIADVERVAATPLSVVLLGASGTGKEVVASELHRLSRRTGRFCAINCAAIPPLLIESELFGFKRGAFSGADRDKPGLIRTAHEGTLFLDEIGDMPLDAQAKLLRVLQSKELFPLGATAPERVDVRVIAATHRNLTRLQHEGRFREDLFARLNEYEVRLPPLHERKEDVLYLTRTFLTRHGRPDIVPSFQFMTGLLHYDWPYNVRELEACIKRAVALSDGGMLGPELLPDSIQEAMTDYGRGGSIPPRSDSGIMPPTTPLSAEVLIPSETELRGLLAAYKGNVAAVGRELGKARMQVHRWMKRYGISVDDYRE